MSIGDGKYTKVPLTRKRPVVYPTIPNPSTGKEIGLAGSNPVDAVENESGASVNAFVFISEASDVIYCSNDAGRTIQIAKPYMLRGYISTRTVGTGVDEEAQKITPDYTAGELIIAAYCETGITGVYWNDLNTAGRAWAVDGDA